MLGSLVHRVGLRGELDREGREPDHGRNEEKATKARAFLVMRACIALRITNADRHGCPMKHRQPLAHTSPRSDDAACGAAA